MTQPLEIVLSVFFWEKGSVHLVQVAESFSLSLSLRNYNLHVDQIKDLDPDPEDYAENVADALAALCWGPWQRPGTLIDDIYY